MKTENKEQQTLPQDSGRDTTAERDKWLDALEFVLESVLKERDSTEAPLLLSKLATRLRDAGVDVPTTVGTPYINTIPADNEPPYPGNREIERRIKSYTRWNAMAMVVKANRLHGGLGGHISTYASSAT
ncbi:MAG: 2-oxo-acid dehydrogenase subunit, homodimeric type, partial [Bacteroidetes bacterium]|nr:2-oxo-acid dehydrogenase subunit, homodimeric type [Bacteroidota bacterium]